MAVSEGSDLPLSWFAEGAGLKERIGGVFRRASRADRLLSFAKAASAAGPHEGLAIGGRRGRSGAVADAGAARPDAIGSRDGADIGRDYRIAHRGDPSGVLVLTATTPKNDPLSDNCSISAKRPRGCRP